MCPARYWRWATYVCSAPRYRHALALPRRPGISFKTTFRKYMTACCIFICHRLTPHTERSELRWSTTQQMLTEGVSCTSRCLCSKWLGSTELVCVLPTCFYLEVQDVLVLPIGWQCHLGIGSPGDRGQSVWQSGLIFEPSGMHATPLENRME